MEMIVKMLTSVTREILVILTPFVQILKAASLVNVIPDMKEMDLTAQVSMNVI